MRNIRWSNRRYACQLDTRNYPPAQTNLPAEGEMEGNSEASAKGMSLRAIERELGIHRSTIKKYMDADGPPGRRSRPVLTASTSDTVAPLTE